MVASNGAPKDAVPLERFAPLYLISDTPKGRGVFAGRAIASGTIVDTCAVLILDPEENAAHVEKTALYHYTYNWPLVDANGTPVGKTQAVVFGLGSMFNHSAQDQNIGWARDLEHQLVVYRALRDIREGEELCISYGDWLTFADADEPHHAEDTPDVADEAEELLSKIQLE